jgi:hypothetical protein
MDSKTLKKCAYPPCQCLVESGEKFCGGACANASDPHQEPCLCGHAGCAEVSSRLTEGGKSVSTR